MHATGLGRESLFRVVCEEVARDGRGGRSYKRLIQGLQRVLRIPRARAQQLLYSARATSTGDGGTSPERILGAACELARETGRPDAKSRHLLDGLAEVLGLPSSEVDRLLRTVPHESRHDLVLPLNGLAPWDSDQERRALLPTVRQPEAPEDVRPYSYPAVSGPAPAVELEPSEEDDPYLWLCLYLGLSGCGAILHLIPLDFGGTPLGALGLVIALAGLLLGVVPHALREQEALEDILVVSPNHRVFLGLLTLGVVGLSSLSLLLLAVS